MKNELIFACIIWTLWEKDISFCVILHRCKNHLLFIKYILVIHFSLTTFLVPINQLFNSDNYCIYWYAFNHNTNTLQWIGYIYNYALKSALLPHANTQSPDITECNRLLWKPECFYEPVSLTHIYTIYISPAEECITMLGQSQNCSSL